MDLHDPSVLEAVFERMPLGVAVFDRDGNVLRFNQTWHDFLRRYQPPDATPPAPGVNYFAMVPGAEAIINPLSARVMKGETFRVPTLRLGTGDTASFWDTVFAPFYQEGEIVGIINVSTDVTDQVRSEELARAREHEFQAIFEAATDGIIINDPETGRVAEANPAACRMHGYTHDEFVGIVPQEFIHPESHFLYEQYVMTVGQGGLFRARAKDVRKDGSVVNVEVTGRRFTYRGRPHLLAIVRDVTEEVRTLNLLREREAQLAASEAELRAVFAAMTEAIFVFNPQGVCVRVAPTNPTTFSAPTEDLVGTNFPALFPDAAEHMLAAIRQTLETGGPVSFEYPLDPVGQGTRWFGARITAIGDGNVLWIARDITDERRTVDLLRDREAQIAASEAELRALFAAMTDAIFQIAPDGTCVSVAPTSPEYIRIPTDNLVGRRFQDLFPDVKEDFLETIQRALETNTTLSIEYELALGGKPTWFAARVSPVGDGTVIWVSRDITKRVQAYQILEQTVEERTRELTTLLNLSREAGATLELQPLLRIVLDQLRNVVDYTAATLFTLREGKLFPMEHQGPVSQTIVRESPGFVVKPGSLYDRILSGLQPEIIDDIRDPAQPKLTNPAGEEYPLPVELDYIRSWMGIPLVHKDKAIGLLSIDHSEPGYLTAKHASIATAFAAQAAIAIENARLFEEATLRAREKEALSDVAAALAFDRPMVDILDEIALRVGEATTGVAATVTVLDSDGAFVAGGHSGLPENFAELMDECIALGAQNPSHAAFHAGRRVIIRGVKEIALNAPEWGPLHDTLRSQEWDVVVLTPMVHRGRPLGTVDVYYPAGKEPGEAELRLISAIAGQTALAVENTQLFDETARRVKELDALYRADAELHRSLRVSDVFEAMIDVVENILQPDKTAVITWEGAGTVALTRVTRGFNEPALATISIESGAGAAGEVLRTGELFVTEDARNDPRVNRRVIEAEGIRAFMHAPIRIGGQIYGVFNINYTSERKFTEEEKRLFTALAQRAGLALENARLFEQAQQVASLKERQRLARELHDSVSQALYGIALGARTARTLLDQDPPRAVQPVDYVMSLAEAGLAEMRALIFELRPESLESEGIVAAIEKQAASLRARYGFEVNAALTGEPDIPLAAKEALYRIAQEAMHNAVKHARARVVDVSLRQVMGVLTLEIRDNGAGFDPGADFPGHLGLRSMRERAAQIGGHLAIESGAGKGTVIRATLPVSRH